MTKKQSYLTVTDQFCGAGGSSQGVRKVAKRIGGGIEVKLALNHWQLAIETHNTNFPDTLHDCTDIQACDPRRYPSTDILITSPECTNHSLAKGVRRQMQGQVNLFGMIPQDAAADRSRATMWDVPRFAEFHRYNIIITENVAEARSWVCWNAWLKAMQDLGYQHRCVYHNSMFHYPTPQSRDRMYVVFWRKGNPVPDLDFSPDAYCQHCEGQVAARQHWKRNERQFGKYKQQYIYRCPDCHKEVSPYYHAAFNCIDWTIPSQRIGDRKTPLAAKTIERIQAGLDKFHNRVFIATNKYSKGTGLKEAGDALPTQLGGFGHGIVFPMVIETGHSQSDLKARQTLFPIFTQTTAQTLGIAIPILVGNYSPGWSRLSTEPTGTVTTADHHGVLSMPMIVENYSNGPDMRPSFERLGCVTAGGNHYGLLTTKSIQSFLASYYSGSHVLNSAAHSISTVTTVERTALVEPNGSPNIEDCHYRMLVPREIQAAMAFDEDYVVLGNSREKVKQLGNAVTPPVMEWLIGRCVETLN